MFSYENRNVVVSQQRKGNACVQAQLIRIAKLGSLLWSGQHLKMEMSSISDPSKIPVNTCCRSASVLYDRSPRPDTHICVCKRLVVRASFKQLSECIFMYVHTRKITYVHTYKHTYIYSYIHLYKHTYIHTYIHIVNSTNTRANVKIHTYMYVHTNMYVSYMLIYSQVQSLQHSPLQQTPCNKIPCNKPPHLQQQPSAISGT